MARFKDSYESNRIFDAVALAADAANKTVPAVTRATMSQKQRKKIVPELEFVMENLNNDIEKSDIYNLLKIKNYHKIWSGIANHIFVRN